MTGSWGTSQHAVFASGDELIENYLVLDANGTERRYFRVKETLEGVTNVTSTTCAKGSYVLLADASFTSDLEIRTSSPTTDAPPLPVQASHEEATARLVGPQLRIERIDTGDRGSVLIYDRLDLPADIDGDCPR